jgi:hypothetical protein
MSAADLVRPYQNPGIDSSTTIRSPEMSLGFSDAFGAAGPHSHGPPALSIRNSGGR